MGRGLKMNIGVIGGGAIAQFLFDNINIQKAINAQVTSVFVRDVKKYNYLHNEYGVELFTNFDEFLNSNIDIVIEAATIDAVKQLIPTAIKKKDVIIVSIGALADQQFLQNLYNRIKKFNKQVHLPSGAIGGLDLLQNAHALDEVDRVTLTTRKPAHTLTDELLDKEKVIFTGPAIQAIEKFPENVNVSIVLSLAGIGVANTIVNIIADPSIKNNNHTINVEGAFGQAIINVENKPLQENPKTSYLAALSVLGTLRSLNRSISIG